MSTMNDYKAPNKYRGQISVGEYTIREHPTLDYKIRIDNFEQGDGHWFDAGKFEEMVAKFYKENW